MRAYVIHIKRELATRLGKSVEFKWKSLKIRYKAPKREFQNIHFMQILKTNKLTPIQKYLKERSYPTIKIKPTTRLNRY
jgi:hypothetical protein